MNNWQIICTEPNQSKTRVQKFDEIICMTLMHYRSNRIFQGFDINCYYPHDSKITSMFMHNQKRKKREHKEN